MTCQSNLITVGWFVLVEDCFQWARHHPDKLLSLAGSVLCELCDTMLLWKKRRLPPRALGFFSHGIQWEITLIIILEGGILTISRHPFDCCRQGISDWRWSQRGNAGWLRPQPFIFKFKTEKKKKTRRRREIAATPS